MSRVIIISVDDKEAQISQKAFNMLESFQISAEQITISSDDIFKAIPEAIKRIEDEKADVVIATAGIMPSLPGIIASYVSAPVLSVPVSSRLMNGLDSLMAALKTPSKCTAPVLAIDNGENAALMAARILAVGDSDLAEKMILYKESMIEHVKKQNEKLQEELQ